MNNSSDGTMNVFFIYYFIIITCTYLIFPELFFFLFLVVFKLEVMFFLFLFFLRNV